MNRYYFYFFVALLTLGIGIASSPWSNSTFESHSTTVTNTIVEAEKVNRYNFFSTKSKTEEITNTLEPKKTFCSDARIQPIWNAIRREKEWLEILDYTTESPNCADMFEIKDVDLNRDGKKEILVRGKTIQMCGGVGNCQFWIFDKGYRILLNESDYFDRSKIGQQVQPSRTNGYSDLLLKGHFSAGVTSFSYYKFNGKKYVESRCLYEVYSYNSEQKAVAKFVTCTEFYRGRGL